MRKNLKSLIQYLILLSVGGALVYLSFRKTSVSREEVLSAFSNANWFWITVSLIISFLSHYARAYRWNYLLENYQYKTDILTSLASVLIGYLANYGLPRMGEISRCAVVNKYNKIPMDIALGSVIAERIIDLLLMFVVFLLVILAKYEDLHSLLNIYIVVPLHEKLQNFNVTHLFILMLVTITFTVLIQIKKKNKPESWLNKVITFIHNLLRPLLNIHKLKRPIGFWLWSLLIWLMYFLSMYTCALSMDATEHLGIWKVLVLFLFGTVGVIITPGGIGAYHFLITEILLFYQVKEASAVAFPWIVWGTQFLLIIFSGTLSFILLPIIYSKNDNR